ncbi:hypothetical protein Tco_0054028, partial [Tanacetum coccineum]
MIRRYGYMFRHLKQSSIPRKYFGAINKGVYETLKEVVPKMIDHNTNESMKNNLPRAKERENNRVELSGQVTNDVANIVPTQVDSFLRDYMSNHILHVHPTSSASSSILDLQHQFVIVRTHDHEDHHDDDARPEWESNAKRQRTSEFRMYITDDQGIDDDEVPTEEVSPELLAEVSKREMAYDDIQRMQNAINIMMRDR